MACSMPPMYWSTGIQRSAAFSSTGAAVSHGSQKRRKYQDESTNVSIVSVSRCARWPQRGQVVHRKASSFRSGDSPVGRNWTSSGNRTGRSLFGQGHNAVIGAINDRDRAAPIPLARDQPVPQPVLNGALTDAFFLDPLDRSFAWLRPYRRCRSAIRY